MTAETDSWDQPPRGRVVDDARPVSERVCFYRAFWQHFADRIPDAYRYKRGNEASRWQYLPAIDLVVARYVTYRSVGVFVRGRWGTPMAEIVDRLRPHADALAHGLEVPLGRENFPYLHHLRVADARDPAEWDRMADWVEREGNHYAGLLNRILGGGAED